MDPETTRVLQLSAFRGTEVLERDLKSPRSVVIELRVMLAMQMKLNRASNSCNGEFCEVLSSQNVVFSLPEAFRPM